MKGKPIYWKALIIYRFVSLIVDKIHFMESLYLRLKVTIAEMRQRRSRHDTNPLIDAKVFGNTLSESVCYQVLLELILCSTKLINRSEYCCKRVIAWVMLSGGRLLLSLLAVRHWLCCCATAVCSVWHVFPKLSLKYCFICVFPVSDERSRILTAYLDTEFSWFTTNWQSSWVTAQQLVTQLSN